MTFLLILLLSCAIVAACIFVGFVIDVLIRMITDGIGAEMPPVPFEKKLFLVVLRNQVLDHAVVKSVRSYKMCINEEGRKYSYDYATCVGIKEKDVHDTKAVLIFIPDDVLIFPDKDQREQPQ